MLTVFSRCLGDAQWPSSDRALEVSGPQRFSFIYKKYWEGVFLTHLQCDITLCSRTKESARAYGLPVVSFPLEKQLLFMPSSPVVTRWTGCKCLDCVLNRTSGTLITGMFCWGGNHFHALYFDAKSLIVEKIWRDSIRFNWIWSKCTCLQLILAYEAEFP